MRIITKKTGLLFYGIAIKRPGITKKIDRKL